VAGDSSSLRPAALQAAADGLVDPEEPGSWTHALMDIGATICRPARPACASCPARPWCRAARAMAPPIAHTTAGTAARTARAGAGISASGSRAPVPRTAATRPASIPFERTTRWLRGRIVDRLREVAPGEALAVDGPLGTHPAEAVTLALAGLARDGIVELDGAGRARLAGSPEPA